MLEFRNGVRSSHPELFTPGALSALEALAAFEPERVRMLSERMARRRARFEERRPLAFLDPDAEIPRTGLTVRAARGGDFVGSEIPPDLARQWIQGTGPATRPRATIAEGLRNVAYALLSGADGWMFDGEDALGQVDTMSLDNQRNLKLAIARDPAFLARRRSGRRRDERVGRGLLRPADRRRLARPARLHDPDLPAPRPAPRRPPRPSTARRGDRLLGVDRRSRRCTSSTTTARCGADGRSVVLYLPKIQTAEEAALWNDLLAALEAHLGLPTGTIKVYVLVERSRPASSSWRSAPPSARHFVGFNTGRWDYINSVADAMRLGPRASSIPTSTRSAMTYGYMRVYEDRVRRAVNTPDREGRCALWQGGMEPNIPVGSQRGRRRRDEEGGGRRRARAAPGRERQVGGALEDGAHRAPGVGTRRRGQPARPEFPRLTYTDADARGADAARAGAAHRARRARPAQRRAAVRQRVRRGFQAAALKPADFFGDDDVLYLMEDMATGEIRASILWEWLHKGAPLTEDDPETGVRAGRPFDRRALRPPARRGVRQAAGGERPRRPRRLEAHDAARRARDRRGVRLERRQAALVRRPAEPQPRQPRPAARARRASPRYLGGAAARRHAHHRQPRFRGRGTGRADHDRVRPGGRASPRVVRQPALRGHRPALLGAPGGRAARHDRPRLHRRARSRGRAFHERLRELFAEGKSITTFGPVLAGPGGDASSAWASRASTSAAGRPPPRARPPRIPGPTSPATR